MGILEFLDAIGASARAPQAMAAMPPRADAPRSPAPDPYAFGDLTSETARRAYEDMLALAGMGGQATRSMLPESVNQYVPDWLAQGGDYGLAGLTGLLGAAETGAGALGEGVEAVQRGIGMDGRYAPGGSARALQADLMGMMEGSGFAPEGRMVAGLADAVGPQARAGLLDMIPNEYGGANLGGLYYALGRLPEGTLENAVPFTRRGSEDFAPRRAGDSRAKDPSLYTDFSTIKQDRIAPAEWEVTGRRLQGLSDTPTTMTPADIKNKFDVLYGYPADATMLDVIIDSVNGVRLPNPTLQQAGHTFTDRPVYGFASEPQAMAARNNAWQAAMDEGQRVAVSPMVMGPKGGDFSQHVGQTMAQLIRGAENEIDPSFAPNLPGNASEYLTGLLDPRLPYFIEGLKGGERGKFMKALDTGPAAKAGVPSAAAARWATTDPNLMGASLLDSGYRLFEPAKDDFLRRHGGELHSTYGAIVDKAGPSMTMGGPRPWYLMYPDLAFPRMNASTKPGANMPKANAMPKDLRGFQMNPNLRQDIDQQWVDVNSKYDEIRASEGKDAADMFAMDALLARASRMAR